MKYYVYSSILDIGSDNIGCDAIVSKDNCNVVYPNSEERLDRLMLRFSYFSLWKVSIAHSFEFLYCSGR